MAMPDIPQEILIDIFSRLPTKSVGKCRCVAKQWRTLLYTPGFIKSHLTQRPNQENIIFLEERDDQEYIVSLIKEGVCRTLEFISDDWNEIVGSCDGMVLLTYFDLHMFLVNPITFRHVVIPNPPQMQSELVNVVSAFSMRGFGYDKFNEDYKVVQIHSVDEEKPDIYRPFVDVYSVKSGVWRRVGVSPYPSPSSADYGVFVNGAIHWLIKKDLCGNLGLRIAFFNLADEVFDEISFPSSIDMAEFMKYCELVALDGCLGIMGFETQDRTDIWVMKKYGLTDSWTKFSIHCDCYRLGEHICFIGHDEAVFLERWRNRFVVYNLKDGTYRDMVVDGIPDIDRNSYIHACSFVESLVSPASTDN